MKLQIILADDHQMFRQALRAMLEKEPDIEIVAEASDGNELLKLAAEVPVDLVCMDIGMPNMNGIEATRRLLALRPDVKVIGLSAFHDRDFVLDLMKAGASGYVTKTEAGEELLRAIQARACNRKYLCSDVAARHRGSHQQSRREAGQRPTRLARAPGPSTRRGRHDFRPDRRQPPRLAIDGGSRTGATSCASSTFTTSPN